MKKKLALAMLLLTSGAATGQNYTPHAFTLPTTYVQPQQKHVQTHSRANGSYVQPYERSVADNARENNWSSKPDVNPYTSKEDSKNPYANPYGH